MSKKVLIDVERRKYPYSGLGIYCQSLQRGLREAYDERKYSWDYLKLCFYGPESILDECSSREQLIRHHHWHKRFNPGLWGFTLVHVTHQLQRYLPLSYNRCAKVVVTLHDLNFLHEPLPERRLKKRLRDTRLNLERADVIICISEFVRQDLERNKALFHFKPSVRIEVVYNGIIFSDEEPEPSERLLKAFSDRTAPDGGSTLGATEPSLPPYLLSIGELCEKKQQHLLIEAMRHLPAELCLVLVYSTCKEDYKDMTLELVQRLGLTDRVILLNTVSSAEKRWLLQHCQMYVHPSLAEGFGIPPVEAMHEGRPVCLSPLTSLPEVGGAEAYYFTELKPEAMARDILKGLEDYASQPDKSACLKQWSQRYDYRVMAASYIKLYAELLRGG